MRKTPRVSSKKAKTRTSDDLRPKYKRSDFGEIVRGKYAHRVSKETNLIVLDPKLSKCTGSLFCLPPKRLLRKEVEDG